MANDQSLEDLFTEVRRNLPIKTKGEKPKEERNTSAMFLDPTKWTRVRGVALIHRDTETLLGNFSEYTHLTIPGCRKLVREESPISVSHTEYVEGSWWLGQDRKPEPKQAWHEMREAILHIHLEELKVHAPICEVIAHLSYGSIARVELALDTRFAQTEGREQFLDLPSGTNILDCMSLDCKINLRKEIGL